MMGNILNKVEERMDAYEEESHREDKRKMGKTCS